MRARSYPMAAKVPSKAVSASTLARQLRPRLRLPQRGRAARDRRRDAIVDAGDGRQNGERMSWSLAPRAGGPPIPIEPEITIGRDPSCTINTTSAAASRLHLVLRAEGETLHFE